MKRNNNPNRVAQKHSKNSSKSQPQNLPAPPTDSPTAQQSAQCDNSQLLTELRTIADEVMFLKEEAEFLLRSASHAFENWIENGTPNQEEAIRFRGGFDGLCRRFQDGLVAVDQRLDRLAGKS